MARRLHGGPKGYRNWTWECHCGARGWKPVTHSNAHHNGRMHNRMVHGIDEPVNVIRMNI
jgi:hypothetical protein